MPEGHNERGGSIQTLRYNELLSYDQIACLVFICRTLIIMMALQNILGRQGSVRY